MRYLYWKSPEGVKYRHYISGVGLDVANGALTKYDEGAIMLEIVGYYDRIVHSEPKIFFDLSEWAVIPVQSHAVPLYRPGKPIDARNIPP